MMTRTAQRRSQGLGTQLSELAIATPQVVAHRMARMASAGPLPNSRDQREFQRMSVEKVAAFGESWQAMALQMLRTQHQWGLEALRTWWSPLLGQWPAGAGATSAWQTAQQMHEAGLSVLGQGLAPVHRRAVANAKRLRRTSAR